MPVRSTTIPATGERDRVRRAARHQPGDAAYWHGLFSARRLVRARLCYARSLQIATDVGDRRIMSLVVANLATQFLVERKYREAEQFLVYGIQIAR